MIISAAGDLPLSYFPVLTQPVKPDDDVNRKFLLKCETLVKKDEEIILQGDINKASDIVFEYKQKKSANKYSVLFSANREDLVRYTSLYDGQLDIYPVDSLEFKPIDFVVDDSCLWVVFTSKRAVDFFLEKINVRFFCSKKIAAVGSKTAEKLNKYGFKMDYVPDEFYGASLIEFLKDKENVLVVAPEKYNKSFDELKNVKIVPVYENVISKNIDYYRYDDRWFDFGLFSSPSAFWHIKEALKSFDFAKRIKKIIAIGKTTKNYIESCGFNAEMPDKATIKDMFEYIKKV